MEISKSSTKRKFIQVYLRKQEKSQIITKPYTSRTKKKNKQNPELAEGKKNKYQSKKINNTLKGSYTMVKWNLSQGRDATVVQYLQINQCNKTH